MEPLKLLSPAKINLSLRILNRRSDGHHNLLMVMEKISLFDEIIFEKIPSGIELAGSPPDVPVEKNLAYRAAKLLQESSGVAVGARLQLSKRIPMGGGLGGGSSNAATVLKGLNVLWDLKYSTEKLAQIGVRLGADVPFFIHDGPALVGGIGDLIKPLKKIAKLWIILVNPGVHVSTPLAYQMWDKKGCAEKGSDPSGRGGKSLTQKNQNVRDFTTFQGTFGDLLQVLRNDFEGVVFPEFPEIQRAKEILVKAGAGGALMSGSGSTVFGLFETKEGRERAFAEIKRKRGWRIFLAENC